MTDGLGRFLSRINETESVQDGLIILKELLRIGKRQFTTEKNRNASGSEQTMSE